MVSVDANGWEDPEATQTTSATITSNTENGIETNSNEPTTESIPVIAASDELQSVVTDVSNFKKKNGISPVQQVAKDNATRKENSGTVGAVTTYGGAFLSMLGVIVPEPSTTIVGLGYLATAGGVGADAYSRTIETDPEKILLRK